MCTSGLVKVFKILYYFLNVVFLKYFLVASTIEKGKGVVKWYITISVKWGFVKFQSLIFVLALLRECLILAQ